MINRFLSVSLVTLLISSVVLLSGCSSSSEPPHTAGEVTELELIDVVLGTGAEARSGQSVTVHYSGWLYDETAVDKKGSKFDSSIDRDKPFKFPLGAGRVIKGWDQGVAGMKVGGQRTIMIPSDFGYGARGAGSAIPANASLVFEVKLLEVE